MALLVVYEPIYFQKKIYLFEIQFLRLYIHIFIYKNNLTFLYFSIKLEGGTLNDNCCYLYSHSNKEFRSIQKIFHGIIS